MGQINIENYVEMLPNTKETKGKFVSYMQWF